MTIQDWIKDYINGFYNILICWLVKRTFLRASTMWEMMKRMDERTNEREMEYYVNEYKRWKENGYK